MVIYGSTLSFLRNQFTGAISQIIGIESAINLEIKISTRTQHIGDIKLIDTFQLVDIRIGNRQICETCVIELHILQYFRPLRNQHRRLQHRTAILLGIRIGIGFIDIYLETKFLFRCQALYGNGQRSLLLALGKLHRCRHLNGSCISILYLDRNTRSLSGYLTANLHINGFLVWSKNKLCRIASSKIHAHAIVWCRIAWRIIIVIAAGREPQQETSRDGKPQISKKLYILHCQFHF